MRNFAFVILVLFVFLLSGCKFSKPYSIEQAKENGDVISYEEGGKSENVVKLLAFIENVNENKESHIRIVYFNQSPPVIADLTYDGKNIIYNKKTNPEDDGKEIDCKQISDSEMGIFGLSGCQGDKENIGILSTMTSFYDKAKRELNK